MTSTRERTLEQLKDDTNVKKELAKTAANPKVREVPIKVSRHLWLLGYLCAFVALGIAYYLLRFGYLDAAGAYVATVERVVIGAIAVTFVLLCRRSLVTFFISSIENLANRYNLKRITDLLAGLSIFFITISVLFANWYTAVVSFGLISLVLGFALQTPITSFIGWVYILFKEPYRVGDRIKIGNATGDVIDVEYLDTTLWEFGGPMLSTIHHPSGRIIKFPNSMVLSSAVYNYSWPLFPYIWNDVKFQIAYQSDLEFVAETMRNAATKAVGEAMMQRVGVYRELLSQTAVDQLEVKEHPAVIFRVNDNTWIEAIVRYLVEPRRAGSVKTALIKDILKQLNAEPDRVMFPKGDNR